MTHVATTAWTIVGWSVELLYSPDLHVATITGLDNSITICLAETYVVILQQVARWHPDCLYTRRTCAGDVEHPPRRDGGWLPEGR